MLAINIHQVKQRIMIYPYRTPSKNDLSLFAVSMVTESTVHGEQWWQHNKAYVGMFIVTASVFQALC